MKVVAALAVLERRSHLARVSNQPPNQQRRKHKVKSKIAITLVIAGLLSIGAWSGQGQTEKAQSVAFEYQLISHTYDRDEFLKHLNQLGAQGWEITGVVQHGDSVPTLYLKRVKR